MKRRLTSREWILLGLLAVVALVSGYVTLFRMPMAARRDSALEETELVRLQLEAAQLRAEDMRRMERELEEIFAEDSEPVGLAPFDNIQPVMMELNSILSGAADYSLTFGTVDAEESIVRRSIALTFTSGSYAGAKGILQQLHDSAYRCMLDSLTISINREDGSVDVSGTIVFFEYQ